MSDERLRAAMNNWGPRMIANGVDYNDFVRTTDAVSRWEEWLDAWTATADVHRLLGEEWQAADRPRSAGEAFLRAAVTYHFSKFVWVLDVERNRAATRAAIAAMAHAHALLDPTAERIVIALDGGDAVGNLRRPSTPESAPLVLLLPGLDSTKEEFWLWENVFLGRGMATFSFDGPGQGETGFVLDIWPDYERAVSVAIDTLEQREDIDVERIGGAGVSLGGYYIARAAASEPRLRAVAGVSGPFDMNEQWDFMPSLTRETFAHHSGASDLDDAHRRAALVTLEGVCENIRQPHLVITGARDRVVPWEQTKRIADESPLGEWVLFDDGTHVCNNIPFKYRPLVADWLLEHLR